MPLSKGEVFIDDRMKICYYTSKDEVLAPIRQNFHAFIQSPADIHGEGGIDYGEAYDRRGYG